MVTITQVREVETLTYPEGYDAAADESRHEGDSDFAAMAAVTNITTDDGISVPIIHGSWSAEDDWRDRKFTAKTKTRTQIKTEARALHALRLAEIEPPHEWEGQDLATI